VRFDLAGVVVMRTLIVRCAYDLDKFRNGDHREAIGEPKAIFSLSLAAGHLGRTEQEKRVMG